MAEPVLPAIGAGIGVVNFLSSSFATVARMNSVRHSALRFKYRVAALRRRVESCEAKYLDWTTKWKYDSNSYPDAVYRELWGTQYEIIDQAWKSVNADLQRLYQHIQSVLDEKRKTSGWKDHLALHRKAFLRNIAFALASESSLEDEIGRLERSLENLYEASENQLKNIAYISCDLTVDPVAMMRLANLRHFGEQLDPKLSELPSTSAWSLELCHPDIGANAEEWNNLPSIQVWLSYIFNNGPRQRIKLRYSLDGPSQPAWMIPVTNDSVDDTPQVGETQNPEASRNHPIARQTEPFSGLLMRGAFKSRLAASAWQADKAYLILSLVNWSILLWTSDWTSVWCCSGLRFVQVEASSDVAGKKELFLPSFSRCMRRQQQQQEQEQEQRQPGDRPIDQ